MGDVKCQECKPDDVMVTFENGIFKKSCNHYSYEFYWRL